MSAFFVVRRSVIFVTLGALGVTFLTTKAEPVLAQPQSVRPLALPAMGDGEGMTTGAERKIGERVARELYRDPDYIDDPVLAEYVQGIWQPLMAAARERGELSAEMEERFAWEILLGKDRSINAFALPGGYLGVHLGLIGAVTSRDELASVLAHELSHVTQRHISRLINRQGQMTPLLIGSMILGALAASKNPHAASALVMGGQAVTAQNQLNFSRDMEREADRVGYGVMTQAGFDGQGFVTMFDKLQQASRMNDNGSFPYLRSHPLTTERIADMQSRQQLLPKSVGAQTLEHAMVAARARVLAQPGVDVLRLWMAEPDSSGFAQGPAGRRVAALYAAALSASKLREVLVARQMVERLEPLVRGDAAAARLLRLLSAEVEMAAGNPKPAAMLALSGQGPRPELLLAAQARLSQAPTSGADEVAQSLQTWVSLHPRDATVWQALAAARLAAGQPLRALRAEAESHVAHLDYAAAVDRFKAAQDLVRQGGPAARDHVEASIIDTRAREVGLLLREQAAEH